MALCALPAQALAGPQDGDGAVTVAMDYVVPPFVGGSKVRTPEAIDTALAEALAARMHAELAIVPSAPAAVAAASGQGRSATLVAKVPEQSLSGDIVTVATGYHAGPMAIMRSDTDIRSWADLQGRKVCLSEGGRYVGKMASEYGAIEMVKRAPADSLLALRTGGCDAAVHDNVMLEQLLTYPEWKKFSARLNPPAKTALVFAVPTADAAMVGALQQLAADWKADNYLADLTKQRVRDIAFEVYLDQAVADCH